jgi:hypothetical protein
VTLELLDPVLRAQIEIGGPNECWPWTGRVWWDGYPARVRRAGGGRPSLAQVVWEAEHGRPMPAGLVPDHRCHNVDLTCPGRYDCRHRRCENPAHIEPVTSGENVARGRERARLRRLSRSGVAA